MTGYDMGFWLLWPLLLIIGLVALVWGLLRATSSSGTAAGARQQGGAREVLRERFARGEITEQELRERMRVLDEL